MIDFNIIKEKFFMFSNKPTHELILGLDSIKLCLVVEDFQIFIRAVGGDIIVSRSHKYSGGHSVKTTIYMKNVKTIDECEIIEKIEEYINGVSKVKNWYKNSFRERKLKKILDE